jgi:hypothetical protein
VRRRFTVHCLVSPRLTLRRRPGQAAWSSGLRSDRGGARNRYQHSNKDTKNDQRSDRHGYRHSDKDSAAINAPTETSAAINAPTETSVTTDAPTDTSDRDQRSKRGSDRNQRSDKDGNKYQTQRQPQRISVATVTETDIGAAGSATTIAATEIRRAPAIIFRIVSHSVGCARLEHTRLLQRPTAQDSVAIHLAV